VEQKYIDADREEDDRRKWCVPVGKQGKSPNYLYDLLHGIKITRRDEAGFEYSGRTRMQWRLIRDELKKVIEPEDQVKETEDYA